MLGETDVGKSSLTNRFIYKRFSNYTSSTVGAAYGRITENDITIGFWDTAGQERYLSIVDYYYRGSNIVLMVFDMSNETTIDRFDYYFKKLEEYEDKKMYIFIVGNKSDLIADKEYKISQKITKIFNTYGLFYPIKYFSVSAMNNNGVKELLEYILSTCKQIKLEEEKNNKTDKFDRSVIMLNSTIEEIKTKCEC
jgi:small GTP-binding protein